MQISIGCLTFFILCFGLVNCPFPFLLMRTMSALVNNILYYSHLVTFWGEFFVSSQCTKWWKLVSVRNGSSATSSFLLYRGLFDFLTTQSQVFPAFCSLSGVTLSLAVTTIRSWNNSLILVSSCLFNRQCF